MQKSAWIQGFFDAIVWGGSLSVIALMAAGCGAGDDGANGLFWASIQDDSTEVRLQGRWICAAREISIPGALPGSLYADLEDAGVIPPPFSGTNEEKVQWVGSELWTFESDAFDWGQADSLSKLSKNTWASAGGTLLLDEVMPYAHVLLNGVELGETGGAFRPHSFDTERILLDQGNVLRLDFEPAASHQAEREVAWPWGLPGGEERAGHRLPQFQFGWDWGPTLKDCAVGRLSLLGRPVVPEFLGLETANILWSDDGEVLRAEGRVRFHIGGDEQQAYAWRLVSPDSEQVAFGRGTGRGEIDKGWELDRPALWWTHDLGGQALHRLEVAVQDTAGHWRGARQQVGVRTVALDTSRDEHGQKFQFLLNGRPIFASGSNLVPADALLPRITAEEEQQLVADAAAANMNMLRVWGGGRYASEALLQACDEQGMLLWQDFMFACAMVPGDSAFLTELTQEAHYQVRRLRAHPSVALWCGNNEVAEGWARWGWKDGLSNRATREIQSAYDTVFHVILPAAVAAFSDLHYHPSSPTLGRGDPAFRDSGDAHDWGIWHDGMPFDSLWARVPRFMSEFGCQSFPDSATWSEAVPDPQKDFRHDPAVLAHEKHPRGFDILDAYILEAFLLDPGYADSKFDGTAEQLALLPFSEWAALTRRVQSDGIASGARAHRLHPELCSGSLVWQLNDCWPTASWSSIDAHGLWKPLHHALQDAFAPALIDVRPIGKQQLEIRGVCKSPWLHGIENWETQGTLEVAVIGHESDTLSSHRMTWTLYETQVIPLTIEAPSSLTDPTTRLSIHWTDGVHNASRNLLRSGPGKP
jgi:beta-mannosidase